MTKKIVILAILLFTAGLARADSLETPTFVFPGGGAFGNVPVGTFKNVPLDVGPVFSAVEATTGVQWNFTFHEGDVFGDVTYMDASKYHCNLQRSFWHNTYSLHGHNGERSGSRRKLSTIRGQKCC